MKWLYDELESLDKISERFKDGSFKDGYKTALKRIELRARKEEQEIIKRFEEE